MIGRSLLSAVGALTLAGCVRTARDAGFAKVENLVNERLGKRVQWQRSMGPDEQIDKSIRSMLQKDLSAEEAVQIALLNNRNLQAIYQDLGVAQADLVQVGLLRNPVLASEVRFFGSGTGFELAVVQDFVDALLIPLRKRVAGAALEAAKLRVAAAAIDLTGEVRARFYMLQAAAQTREMRTTVLQATEASYDFAKRLHEAGNITDLDLVNERVLHEQSKIDLARSEAQVVAAREQLNTLMGLWGSDTTWKAASRLPEIPAERPAADGIEKRAVSKSLDLDLARQGIEISIEQLGVARPLAVLAAANIGATGEGNADGSWGAGPALALPVPIFDLGQPAYARVESELRRGQERYYALAVEVRARARAAWNAAETTRSVAEHYARTILPLRHQIVAETQKEYNAMQVGAFQLLTAKQREIEAGAQYVAALRDYWLARVELDQILAGRLSHSEPPSLSAAAREATNDFAERGMP
jgi:cobalt-zinc-cadmium efflux system outer membrane protein